MKVWNLVSWLSGKSLNCCHQKSDFKAKMYQIRWGSLQRSPRPPIAGLRGPTSKGKGWEGKGKRGYGKGRGRRREGKRRGGEGTRPHPFTCPLIHISGYAPVFCSNYGRIFNRLWNIQRQKNSVTLKNGLGVVQDHWKWRRSINHIRLSIGPLL